MNALKAVVINKFALFSIRLSFCEDKREMYDELSDRIALALHKLNELLRKKSGRGESYFYYLYVGDTTEQEKLLREMPRPEFDWLVNCIDVNFNESFGLFENHLYLEGEDAVVLEMIQKGHSQDEVIEFLRNADMGLLTEDWLLSEVECERKFVNVNEKNLRNYYAAMLLIIRARKERKLGDRMMFS